MSYGEQIALRGHVDLETVASAAEIELRGPSEDQFLEKLPATLDGLVVCGVSND